jgi:hypothetical protein
MYSNIKVITASQTKYVHSLYTRHELLKVKSCILIFTKCIYVKWYYNCMDSDIKEVFNYFTNAHRSTIPV